MDGVQFFFFDHFSVVGVCPATRFFCGGMGSVGVDVAYADKLRVRVGKKYLVTLEALEEYLSGGKTANEPLANAVRDVWREKE